MATHASELSPVTTTVVIAILLMINSLPSRVKNELWDEPIFRMLMIAIPVGVAIHDWQVAVIVFAFIWYITARIDELPSN